MFKRNGQVVRTAPRATAGLSTATTSSYAALLSVEVCVLISQICVYKLAAHFFSKEGFAEYALARRTLAFLSPLVFIGLPVAVPRFIAHASAKKDESAGYLGAALWCMLLTSTILIGASCLLPGTFAELFFGTGDLALLIVPMVLLTIGVSLHAVVYAYFRGHLAMQAANRLQLVNLGLVPLAVYLIERSSVRSFILYFAAAIFLVTVAAIAISTPWKEVFTPKLVRVRELLRYGVQRLPGDLALMGLFTLPVTLIAHARGATEAGLAAVGVLFLTIMAAAINPIGLVLLPTASRMFANGAISELRSHLLALLKITILVSVGFSMGFALLAPTIIDSYLGPQFSSAGQHIQIVLFAAVPYCLFLVLSHVIDAFHRHSVTAGIEIVGLLVSTLCCVFVWHGERSASGFLFAFVAGATVLALLAGIACYRIFCDPSRNASPNEKLCQVSSQA